MIRSVPPISFLGELDNGLELGFDNFRALARLTLHEGLSDAKNHRQSSVDRNLGLLRYKFGGFIEKGAALGMT